jgi:hypothetical protein
VKDGYVIDLRSQVARLRPFLDDRGGVVHVRTREGAPASVFARVLRLVMLEAGWKHVQIEPSNPNTHYLSDILIQIMDTCGIPLGGQGGKDALVSVNIGTGIDAGGNVDVSDIDVTVVGDSFENARRERERVQSVAVGLSQVLARSRVALIFIRTHESPASIVRAVRARLWDDALAPLIDEGLLLVDISDPERMTVDPATWPPPPDIAFDLPVALVDDDDRDVAANDIARILLDEQLLASEREAVASGRALVASAVSIADLYASVGRTIAGWQ